MKSNKGKKTNPLLLCLKPFFFSSSFFEKLGNILQNLRTVVLHCRSPGCDNKWHIQSFWLGFSSYHTSVNDAEY